MLNVFTLVNGRLFQEEIASFDELANVRLRETSPGVLRMDHDSNRHDDRAISLALACHRLVEKGERGGPIGKSIEPPSGTIADVAARFAPDRRDLIPARGEARPSLEHELWAAGVVAHDS